jgi:hypothetical protein
MRACCLGEARLHRDDRWYLAGHTAVTEGGLPAPSPVTDQVEPPCRTSSGAGQARGAIARGASAVTSFCTASRARLRRAGPSGPGRAPCISAGPPRGALDERGVPTVSGRGGGESRRWGGSVARCLSAWRRTARATAAAPFPRARRQADPAVTHPGDRACHSGRAVLPRRASCRRAKITVKSARCARLSDGASATLDW